MVIMLICIIVVTYGPCHKHYINSKHPYDLLAPNRIAMYSKSINDECNEQYTMIINTANLGANFQERDEGSKEREVYSC